MNAIPVYSAIVAAGACATLGGWLGNGARVPDRWRRTVTAAAAFGSGRASALLRDQFLCALRLRRVAPIEGINQNIAVQEVPTAHLVRPARNAGRAGHSEAAA